MRVIFMGTPEFAVFPLESLVLHQYQVVAVYTQPDKPAGRGQSLVSPPVKRTALSWNLPVVQPASLKQAETVAKLAEFRPDVIVVAAFGQILPQAVLDIPAYGCINIHPSLLPKYRGASPVAATILAGDELSGISIMLMDAGVDTGPVLARAAVSISPRDNTGSLGVKLSLVAARLLQEVLARWFRHEITPQPQNEDEATYCGPISREAGVIDWNQSARETWLRVRAFNPWPGCYTTWRGKKLKIVEAMPLPGGASKVGEVVDLDKKAVAFGVQTGAGILGVSKVQLEGKRAMPAPEFLRGQREIIGAVLPD